MNQKWHTTINWMEDKDMTSLLIDFDIPSSQWKPDIREALREAVMKEVIPTSFLEEFVPWEKSHTWER